MEMQVEALLRGGQFKQVLENFVRSLREKYDLKRSEIEVLYFLAHCEEYNTAKDITQSLHMNKGHISQTTESLCDKGYLAAAKDDSDYRIIHFTITEEGRPVAQEIDSAIEQLYTAIFKDISAEDMEIFGRIASKMAQNVNRILQNKI